MDLVSARNDLITRKNKLQNTKSGSIDGQNLEDLLQQIDDALEKIDNGTYGFCEVCNDPIEADLLLMDPIISVCIDHLTVKQKRELEDDIQLAGKMQRMLLPKNNQTFNCWEVLYYYEPAGVVSGDYCDLLSAKNNEEVLHFILGDVSGKGIAASMLMVHMHAMFHSLIGLDQHADNLISQANRLFCESTSSNKYATLVYGCAYSDGQVEICNAGHCPPIIIRNGNIEMVEATGLPIGLFCESEYLLTKTKLEKDDLLVLYTDGLTEARNEEQEYGIEKLKRILSEMYTYTPEELLKNIIRDVNNFCLQSRKDDDMTIMVIKRKE